MKLIISSYVLPPSESYPYAISAKRYTSTTGSSNSPDALTLVFAHATGMHKECFEPTIQHLFELGPSGGIRDAWAIDAVQHGHAAILNEEFLRNQYIERCKLFLIFCGFGFLHEDSVC